MRARHILALVILGITFTACSMEQDQSALPPTNMAPIDTTQWQTFTAMAASGGKFEVASSKMALQRSQNPTVRRVAQRMITDHTKSNKKLAAVMSKNRLRAQPTGLMQNHQQALDILSRCDDFDDEYLETQQIAHEQAISLFESYSENGDNNALRQFAAQTLPTLKKHYHMIRHARYGGNGTDNREHHRHHNNDLQG